jgi:hypothetical protein
MKNNDWLCLPIMIFGFYPKHIIEKAKKVKSHDQELGEVAAMIAKNEGVDDFVFTNRWIPRDKFELLNGIEEHPEFGDRSLMEFDDGDFIIVNLHHSKLMARVHTLMCSEPQYRILEDDGTEVTFIPVSQEERDEMEGEDED